MLQAVRRILDRIPRKRNASNGLTNGAHAQVSIRSHKPKRKPLDSCIMGHGMRSRRHVQENRFAASKLSCMMARVVLNRNP